MDLSKSFGERKKKLQNDIAAGCSLHDAQGQLRALQNELSEIGSAIPSYDCERFNRDLEVLAKQLKPKSNRFQFDFNQLSNKRQKEKQLSVPPRREKVPRAKIIGQDILVTYQLENSFTFLEDCTISGEHVLENMESGVLTFAHIRKTIINLKSIPYSKGSIFITDCVDCVILINLSVIQSIQIRLHDLANCKICIAHDKSQNVVIENCKDIIFHSLHQDGLNVQDFNNLGVIKSTQKHNPYRFEEFATADWDTTKLRKLYLSTIKC